MDNLFLKKNIQNAALILGSTVFILFFLECGLRFFDYNPFGEFFESEGRAIFIRPSKNPERIFEATPDTKGYGWGTNISINHYGFRGREYSLEKPTDTYRIIVLGDSITFGNNLPENENYPAKLETKFLNPVFLKNRRRVEVLNLALGGYDTLQEVATLKDIGMQFKPDLVIVGYCINDIGVASGNLNYIKRLQNYGNPVYRLRLLQFIRVQLDRLELINYTNSANTSDNFYASYKNTLADIDHDEGLNKKIADLSTRINTTQEKYLFTRDYTQKNHLQRLRYGFEQLKGLQEKNNFDVAILIIPYLLENNTNQPIYQAIYQIVESEAIRLNFLAINPYAEFLDAGFKKIILKKGDGVHPNALGHEILANKLYKAIDTKLLIGKNTNISEK